MHNLLTEENKKEAEKEYMWRLLVVSLFLLLLLGIILLLSLLPSSILSRSKEAEVLEKKQMLDKSVFSLEGQNLTSLLKDTKEKLKSLEIENNNLPLYVIIENILAYKNPGIKITSFTIASPKEKVREFSLGGIASSRESLVEFKKSLEQEKAFSVNLPISNFAKQTNIDFVAVLTVKVE